MYRYVAFVWDPLRTESVRHIRQLTDGASRLATWTTAHESAGLLVLHSPNCSPVPMVCRLSENHGVVLGNLFTRGREHCQRRDGLLSSCETRRILASGGRELIEQYWGTYVAFMWDAQERRHYVVREPMGNLPCYHTKSHGVDVFFSDIGDWFWLLPTPVAINRKHLSRWLFVYRLLQRESGIEGIDSVLPGEVWVIANGSASQVQVWNPADIANASVVEDPAEAAHRLRETVQSVVNALVTPYDKVALKLSGGLDSSIVAGCLANAPTKPRIMLLNFWSDLAFNRDELQLSGVDRRTSDLIRATTGAGDERYFARLVAERLRLPLQERQRPISLDLMRMYEAPLSVSPTSYFTSVQLEDVEMDLVRQEGIQVFFSGHAGDNLFLATMQPFPAIDHAFRHGLNARLWNCVRETAALSKLSVWGVLRKAIGNGILKRAYSPPGNVLHRPSLLSAEVVREVKEEDFDNAWDPLVRDLPPGTQNLIGGIVESTSFDFVFHTQDFADHVDPLNSQPVWELMLQIPTYNILLGGTSRGLARTAFADLLPPEIRKRQIKGTGSTFYKRVLCENLPFFRDALLDGLLVRNGYLDRQKVAEYFERREPFATVSAYQVFSYMTAEIWMRQWQDIERYVAKPAHLSHRDADATGTRLHRA